MVFHGDTWECRPCSREFLSSIAFAQHLNNSQNHRYPCKHCNRVFQSYNELSQHKITHKPADLRCWGSSLGCDQSFKLPSHIFLHLETDTCPSGITNEELLENILKCKGPWKSSSDDLRTYATPFKCRVCDGKYKRVGSFLQHIESQSCVEGYDTGWQSPLGLLRQLRRNLKLPEQVVYCDDDGFYDI